MKGRNRTLPRAHLPDDAVLLHCAHDGLLLGDGVRQGLFGVNVLLVPRGFSGHNLMPMIGNRNHDRVDVFSRKQFAIVVIALAILIRRRRR